MNTKKCKECLEEININASKCPKCQAYQRPFDRAWRSPLMAFAFIPIAFVIFNYSMWKQDPIYDGDKYFEIRNTSFQFFTGDCGQQIALLGTIENKSDKAIKNVIFDVEYYGNDGKVIDVANDQQYDLVIPPKTSKSFKVSSKAGADKQLYSSSKVSVSKANFDYWQ